MLVFARGSPGSNHDGVEIFSALYTLGVRGRDVPREEKEAATSMGK